ncbi:MAG: M10 family metallopeptidase, partial [Alphaproteobacteria bacterium]
MKNKFTLKNYTSLEPYIQSLLYNFSWTGSSNLKANIKYSFVTKKNSEYKNIEVLTIKEQEQVKHALELWENVANIKFIESTEKNDNDYEFKLLIRKGDLNKDTLKDAKTKIAGNTELRSAVDSSLIVGADIVLSKDIFNNFEPGSASFKTILHEIGHALGLKHPCNYGGNEPGPYLSKEEDNRVYSIMSYHNKKDMDTSLFPLTPMAYDIAAVQFLYGANTKFNNDDTIYKFEENPRSWPFSKKNKSLQTIWDGGGNDTIDASSTRTNNIIDLREGPQHLSNIGGNYFTIAYNAH